MSSRDDDDLRIKMGKPRSKGSKPKRFISRVLQATQGVGVPRATTKAHASQLSTQRARGGAAARLRSATQSRHARRVTIKARLVNLKKVSPQNTTNHLRYIKRGGVTREGEPTAAYDANDDAVDTQAFEERGRGDRHQFRFIVSAEDAVQLGDLRTFTRELVTHMERDCGTRLEWLAVDHWDTDNPHTHILVRGKDQRGNDLILAREYISQGMRISAAEIATEWLGPRTEREIAASLRREVDQERWTSIDRELARASHEYIVQLEPLPISTDARLERTLKLGRLQRLQQMGLAEKVSTDNWRLSPRLEEVLRAMGERGDITRTLQRAMKGKKQGMAIYDSATTQDLVGRVLGKGFADELNDRGYLIVDSLDGRAHYVQLARSVDLAEVPNGAVVHVRAQSAADRAIASLSEYGIYRTARHLALARDERISQVDPEEFVQAHVRRLEALRRVGIVERVGEGVWQVPSDLIGRGRAYDAKRLGGASVEVLSYYPIERQVRAIGATWLDRQLVYGNAPADETGFSGEVRSAIRQRLLFLEKEGFAERRGANIVLRGHLLVSLSNREIESVAANIAAESGRTYRQLKSGDRVSGTYGRSVTLASGKFAVIDDGSEFALVPWRPVLERYPNRGIHGVCNSIGVSWDFPHTRGHNL